MSAIESNQFDDYVEPHFAVWSVIEEERSKHKLILNGQDVGEIDWVVSPSGEKGYIDWLEAEPNLDSRALDAAWAAIALSMRQAHPSLKSVNNPDGILY